MNPNLRVRSRFAVGRGAGLLCLLAFSVSVDAQTHRYSPAGFGPGDPLGRIDVSPRDLTRRKTSIEILCQTFVGTDGDLTDSYCWPPNISDDQKVTQLVVRALEDITFVPAQVDGQPVRVLMNFRVSIQCPDDSCAIESMPNLGYLAEGLGADYVAPQPILPGQSWYEGYEDKLDWIHGYMPSMSFKFNQTDWPMRPRIIVPVGADGAAARGCISFMRLIGDDEEERNRQKLDQALQSIGETRFIPGFVDDRPVAMQFFEQAVLRNAARLVTRPPRNHPFEPFGNRYFAQPLAGRAEAPELYCAE